MKQELFYDLCAFAGAIPYLTIVGILIHYVVRRARYKHACRCGKYLPGFYPSSAALGMVFLLTQVWYRPSLQHVVKARQTIQSEEDDNGGPDAPGKLDRQLTRVRRGEAVETLTLRL